MEEKEARRPFDISDELWAEIEPLLPPGKSHPLGCHNARVDPRRAMNAILFVLRTGCQWNALKATGICSTGPWAPGAAGASPSGTRPEAPPGRWN
jgi:transposase